MPIITKSCVKLLTLFYLILNLSLEIKQLKIKSLQNNGHEGVNFNDKNKHFPLRTEETSEKLEKLDKLTVDYDFPITKRFLQFFVSRSTGCNVLVNDQVQFRKDSEQNYVEHWILHNNVEDIIPRAVTSNDVMIKFFNYNKKINTFTVYFDFLNNEKDSQFFSIFFQYDAINLIKTFNYYSLDKDKDSFFLEDQNLEIRSFDQLYNYNNFLWKVFNKNLAEGDSESISLNISYDLGPGFTKYIIYSENPAIQFKKKVLNQGENTIVEYNWEGRLSSQNVLIMDVKFPLYFETCKNDYMSIVIVLIGSLFILFVILMLYVVFNSVLFNEI